MVSWYVVINSLHLIYPGLPIVDADVNNLSANSATGSFFNVSLLVDVFSMIEYKAGLRLSFVSRRCIGASCTFCWSHDEKILYKTGIIDSVTITLDDCCFGGEGGRLEFGDVTPFI